MDMIREYLSFDHLQTRPFASTRNSYPHFTRGTRINAPDATPCMPGNVRIHLECSMS